MKVRDAEFGDLDILVHFTTQEAFEAEGIKKNTDMLREGIRAALENDKIARYWILVDETNNPIGSGSIIREWSDWNAGWYWWIQSMYVSQEYRGQGLMNLLLSSIRSSMELEGALELRLYVHNENKGAIKAYQKAGFSKSKYEIMILNRD